MNTKLIISFLILFLFSILSANSHPEDGMSHIDQEPESELSDQEMFDQQIKQILTDMKIADKENIDRPTFRILFEKLMFGDEQLPNDEEAKTLASIVDKVVNEAPESFPTADLMKYIDLEKIQNYLNDLLSQSGFDPKAMEGMMGGDGSTEDAQIGNEDNSSDEEENSSDEEHTKGDL